MAYIPTKAELKTKYGTTNITTASDLDGTGSEDDSRITLAINQAAAATHQILKQRYAVPLTLAANSDDEVYVKEQILALAQYSLYFARGTRDSDEGNQYTQFRKEALARLRNLAIGNGSIDSPLASHVKPPYPVEQDWPEEYET